jgi:alpha-galactosidase
LREIPEALGVAKDMEKLAPEGWLINFINPTSVLGIALMRHAKISSFALCDGNHEPYARLHYLKEAGILPEDAKEVPPEVERQLDLAVGGVNHCTWLVRLNYKGKDYLPAFREKLAARAREEKPHHKAKPRLNFNYALELMDLYGVFPTAVSHTKEYVPFYQGYGVAKAKPEPIIAFDAENRAEEMAEDWKTNEAYASGKTAIDGFFEKGHADHAADIIESMWGSLRKPFYINSANRGAVTNMPDDAFLELRCDVDIHGPRPQPFGLMPRGVLALQQQVLDTHELTVEAAVSHDKRILLRALATDPIINNLSDAKNIMSDLLDAEKDVLPAAWYK